MAIESCTEAWDKRTYSESSTGVRTYTRGWEIYTDDGADGVVDVRAATCIPNRGDAHPDDAEALCVSVNIIPWADHMKWHADATYSTEYPTNTLTCDYRNDSPLNAGRWTCERNYRIWEKYSAEDLDGTAFKNTAGDPLLNPPPIFVTNTIYQLTKYFEDWDDTDSWLINNTVNSVAWLDFGQYTVKCHSAKWERICENGVNCSRVTFELEHNPEGWYPTPVLSIGYRAKDSGGVIGSVVDSWGSATQQPILLSSTGTETTTPFYIDFVTERLYDIGSKIGVVPAGLIGSPI